MGRLQPLPGSLMSAHRQGRGEAARGLRVETLQSGCQGSEPGTSLFPRNMTFNRSSISWLPHLETVHAPGAAVGVRSATVHVPGTAVRVR